MWNVMFGRGVGVGGRGFGVDRDEQASVNKDHSKLIYRTFAASLSHRCSNVSVKLPLTAKNIWTLAHRRKRHGSYPQENLAPQDEPWLPIGGNQDVVNRSIKAI